MNLTDKIQDIKAHPDVVHDIKLNELVNYFGYSRRSYIVTQKIRDFLDENELEVSGDIENEWLYADMTMFHKTLAKTKVAQDPIKRVRILQAANNKPLFVDRNDTLTHAITLMQQNDFSQLPVISGGERTLVGIISWKTICTAQQHNAKGDKVSDYMSEQVRVIKPTDSLLDAIKIVAKEEVVIVQDIDKTLKGIITTADVASEFLEITQSEEFILLAQIERQIRIILHNGGILLADIKKVCKEEDRDVNSIDDLTFGEYIRLFQDDKNWKKIQIKTDKNDFIGFLDCVRLIRNDVMHFDPDGIDSKRLNDLRNMTRYLESLM